MRGITNMLNASVGRGQTGAAAYNRFTLLTTAIRNQSTSSRFQFKKPKEIGKRNSTGPEAKHYFLLVFPATAFGLGVWQTQRRQWKLNLISELESKNSAPPVPLPERISEIESLEYQQVKVSGTFLHDKELFIGPRSLLTGGSEAESRGLSSNPEGIGWHVVTPFRLGEGPRKGDTILVNRGWVPQSSLNPTTRAEGQTATAIDLVGVVRKTEPRQQFVPKNRNDSNRWQFRDIPAMAEKLDTSPIFLDATFESTTPGGPIGGQTKVTHRNDHFSYLVTWFSLSAVSSYMWYAKYLAK